MSKKQRLLFSGLLACGITILVLGFMGGADEDTDVSVSGNPAIDALIPGRETNVLRRTEVGIALAEGFEAALTLETSDGRTIQVPANQLDTNLAGLGRYTFRPGEGQVLDVFPPQSNCVTATYWPVTDRNDAATIRWCFEVT